MDKSILKKFAIESRQDLMDKIRNKIKTFYVDDDFHNDQKGEVYVLSNEKHSLSLTNEEFKKRELLIKRIKELSLEQVIEEAAYTWFNRIIAIRYMEINDMLPLTKDNQSLGIRVLSSKDNTPDPEILKFTNLVNPELDIDFKKEKYVELKDDNEKFKYVLLLVCRKLGRVIPQVFDGITDYIDLLIPDNLLNDNGFVTKLISDIGEEDFKDEVEIIGWLYQYYISEKKDEVFLKLKSNVKIKKEDVPSATQIFTPDWIVKYMVENTICRAANCNEDDIAHNFMYYVKDVKGFESCNSGRKSIEEIKFFDPCCGSGHILVYAFEVFFKLYELYGYNKKEISAKIIKNNIFGMDIDDRAGQLACLTIMLKARKYDKNIFSYNVIPNIMSIKESNNIEQMAINEVITEENKEKINYIIESYLDAKEYGTLLKIKKYNYDDIIDNTSKVNNIFTIGFEKQFKELIEQSKILSQKYDVVVTNPPYMGSKGMSEKLSRFVKKNYNNSKADMFSIFIEKAREYTRENGFYAMITQPTFLFLSSFEKLRESIIREQKILSLLHMGRGIFGIDFGSCAFVLKNESSSKWKGNFYRLHQRTFQYIDVNDIEKIFINAKEDLTYKFDFRKYKTTLPNENSISDDEDLFSTGKLQIKFESDQSDFLNIPSAPMAYWVSDKVYTLFKNVKLGEKSIIKEGVKTGENEKFIREWYEINVNNSNIFTIDNKKKWIKHTKGGNVRKWFGNNLEVLNYADEGKDLRESPKSSITNSENFFKENITWSRISSSVASFRYTYDGFIPNMAGLSMYCCKENMYYYLGMLNSVVVKHLLQLMNPTLNFPPGTISNIPVIENQYEKENVINYVKSNVNLSKEDWDSFEISWDFTKHPLLKPMSKVSTIRDSVANWNTYTCQQRSLLKHNEEELNKIFINIYGLNGELTSEVDDKDITIRKEDKVRDIKSFISYAVGCMFGRYSLDKDGLIYAGGDFDNVYQKYKKADGGLAGSSLSNYKYLNDNGNEIELSFEVDNDNIIPITDEAYFGDDIVERFKAFIKTVYGDNTFNENMDFIAETLGKKGTETSEETIRRYFVNDFFNDHVKMYQKRPIYWLLDSGKKNGFKALIYMHRYNENLIPKARLDYLHRVQTTYEKLLSDVNYRLTTELSMADKKETKNKQIDLMAKLQEIKEYDEKIAHIANQRISIDLDDGVKVNYEKFKDILAKIK